MSVNFPIVIDYHSLVMYKLQQLHAHVPTNKILRAAEQQQQIMRFLGVNSKTQTTTKNFERLAANSTIDKGIFAFLRGVLPNPWQLWIFACCAYITLIAVGHSKISETFVRLG